MTRIISDSASRSIASIGPVWISPALANAMSTRPNRSIASANSASGVAGSAMSPASTAQSGSRAACCSSTSRRRPCSTSFTPLADSASAEARPMPLVPPVTIATLP